MARLEQRTEALEQQGGFNAPVQPPPPTPPSDTVPFVRTLIDFIQWAVTALYYQLLNLPAVADAVYDAAVINDPSVFSTLGNASPTAVTPGTPVAVFVNQQPTPRMCHVRLEPFDAGSKQLLILDTDQTKCTKARAAITVSDVGPRAKVVVAPNQTLYADCTDASGGTQATFSVAVVPIPLPAGRRGALGGDY